MHSIFLTSWNWSLYCVASSFVYLKYYNMSSNQFQVIYSLTHNGTPFRGSIFFNQNSLFNFPWIVAIIIHNSIRLETPHIKISLPLTLHWYYVITTPLWNTRRKTSGTAASQLARYLGLIEHTYFGSLRPSDSAVKLHYGPNLYYTPLPLDFNLMACFLGMEHFHHQFTRDTLPTQTRPHPRQSNLQDPLLSLPSPPLPPDPHINPRSHFWIIFI